MSRIVAVGLGALALALTGCRLDATVTVSMANDVSGFLRIEAVADEELVERAARFAGTDPFDDFRSADLEAAGWAVLRDRDAHRLVLEHPFRNPSELSTLVAGLDPGAPAPVLEDFDARRARGLFSDTYRLTGKVDLTGGGSSEPVAKLLQGIDPQLIDAVAGADLSRSFHLTLRVVLPGEVQEANSSDRRLGIASWSVDAGNTSNVSVRTRRRNVFAIATAVGSAALIGAAVVMSIGVARAAPHRRRS